MGQQPFALNFEADILMGQPWMRNKKFKTFDAHARFLSIGFTLIEVMISVFLVAITLLGIMALQIRMGDYSLDNDTRSRAFLFMQKVSTDISAKTMDINLISTHAARAAVITTVGNTWRQRLTEASDNPANGQTLPPGSDLIVSYDPSPTNSTNTVTAIITWPRKSESNIPGSTDKGQYTLSLVLPPLP
jgi:hypothetical protein